MPTQKYTIEQVLELFETYRMTSADLSERLGCHPRNARALIEKARKSLVVCGFEYSSEDARTPYPIYKLRRDRYERDYKSPSSHTKSSTQRTKNAWKRKFLDLIEEYYIRYYECKRDEERWRVLSEYAQRKQEIKDERKNRAQKYRERYRAKSKIGKPALLVERQPALAVMWMTPVSTSSQE